MRPGLLFPGQALFRRMASIAETFSPKAACGHKIRTSRKLIVFTSQFSVLLF